MSLTDGRPAEAQEIDLLDCTLRDGMYAVDFQLDEGFVAELLTRMNETPVTKVEVGHGLVSKRSGRASRHATSTTSAGANWRVRPSPPSPGACSPNPTSPGWRPWKTW